MGCDIHVDAESDLSVKTNTYLLLNHLQHLHLSER